MQKMSEITSALLSWYSKNKRDLPWRRTKDPYAIWVSEIMLQQTQVDTVIPYYQRWMKKFSTVQELADASLDTVLQLWEGLGYYARARNLHKGAQTVVERYCGEIPSTSRELIELPGIGPYTANAIASIAFDEDVPVVDGNVKRVISRIFLIKNDLKKIECFAKDLLVSGKAGTFNQAVMELGATLCTPKSPRCLECPVQEHCKAYSRGLCEKYPIPAQRVSQKPVQTVAALVQKNGKLLIQQRPRDGLLGGLWQFPLIEKNLSAAVKLGQKLGTYRHIYTHLIETLDLYEGQWVGRGSLVTETPGLKWVRKKELDQYAFTGVCGKIRKELLLRHPSDISL